MKLGILTVVGEFVSKVFWPVDSLKHFETIAGKNLKACLTRCQNVRSTFEYAKLKQIEVLICGRVRAAHA